MTAISGNEKYPRDNRREAGPCLGFRAGAAFFVFFLFFRPAPGFAQNIRMLFEAGWQAYEQGHYFEAKKFFEQVIDQYENFAPAYYALGKVCYDELPLEERSRCLWYFQRAQQIDPQYASSYEGSCRFYYDTEQFNLAEEACLKALSLDEKMYSSKLLLAWVYLSGKKDPDKALQYFDSVLAVASSPVITFGRGMAFIDKGDHARVIEIITELRSQGAQEFANHLEMVLRSKAGPEKLVPLSLLTSMNEEQMKQQQAAQEAAAAQAVAEGQLSPEAGLPSTAQVHIQGKVPVIVPQIQGIQGRVQPQQPPVRGGQSTEQHPGGLTQD
ncbi:MAG TPA: tetratricopeptide repeat protein [Candidatus Omnitrophota bacterium]|nr:tetratricopeptide repeat protein [Candidatus Omnitrophota bacterium]HSA31931.1 tetratricopeptide repeat protein [Candidatus Omnitrophota bacterium]